MKNNSNHSDQRVLREELLSFTQEKANAFSLLFVPPPKGGGMEIRMKYQKRFHRFYQKEKRYHKAVYMHGRDILESRNFQKTKEFIQHGNMTVNSHCINVAKYSLAISEKLGIPVDKRKLIRGALLHDYFLYDWHDDEHNKWYRLHGLKHPKIALNNASKEYDLSDRERDIIRKHMWPLTIVPPMCREAWIVTAADKWCSLLETFKIHKGHGAHRY